MNIGFQRVSQSYHRLIPIIPLTCFPTGLSGKEDWTFEYVNVAEGENARFKDAKEKKEWQDKRHQENLSVLKYHLITLDFTVGLV